MQAPRYIQKNAMEKFIRDQEQKNHLKKLEELGHDIRKPSIDQNVSAMKNLAHYKAQNMKFQDHERLYEINKQNQHLLEKLIVISQRGRGQSHSHHQHGFMNLKTKKEKKDKDQDKSYLHDATRKKNQEKIMFENKQLAQRLLQQASIVNKEKIKDQINDYLKLRKHMSKVRDGDKRENKSIRLPPIHKNQYDSNNLQGYHHSSSEDAIRSKSLEKSGREQNDSPHHKSFIDKTNN